MKIAVIGAGYVGLSLATLISLKHEVLIFDINKKKIDLINNRQSPINDYKIVDFFKNKRLNLKASSNEVEVFESAEFVIICTPTNYNIDTGEFDVEAVKSTIKLANKYNKNCTIVIKSTIPVGFVDSIKDNFSNDIFFSPEFLREGSALSDSLNPTRVIIGDSSDKAKKFLELLTESVEKKIEEIPVEFLSPKEAEAVKLFANTYLAMRIAFYNELDTFAEINNLNSQSLINAIGHDPRIGNFYNNPSFGYGGYCLPKDTQQLLKNYDSIPNTLIKAIVDANVTRKDFIVAQILEKKPKTVGIYRLVMKTDSDNFRDSAVLDIINQIIDRGIEVIVYEPLIDENKIAGVKIAQSLDSFLINADLIVANRVSKELERVKDKIYSRDIFFEN